MRYNLLKAIKMNTITVAISGGADSVVLLHALLQLREEHGFGVDACHINHNLRGAESDADEAFVRDLCKQFGIKLTVHSIDVKALQQKHQGIEEAARNARYSVFVKQAVTATAHTMSDNTETVLLNLIRGTGLKGLCGIPPVRTCGGDGNGIIIRPLLYCERSEIEEYCYEHGLSFVTDSSNLSLDFTRNKIRRTLLPLIKEINPSFDATVTRTCEILKEDSDFLEQSVTEIARKCSFDNGIKVESLIKYQKPLLTRIIMQFLSHNNISPSNRMVSQILELIEIGKGKINLQKHKFALIDDGILEIQTIFQNYRN